jgi:uncharacterized protein YqgQ
MSGDIPYCKQHLASKIFNIPCLDYLNALLVFNEEILLNPDNNIIEMVTDILTTYFDGIMDEEDYNSLNNIIIKHERVEEIPNDQEEEEEINNNFLNLNLYNNNKKDKDEDEDEDNNEATAGNSYSNAIIII